MVRFAFFGAFAACRFPRPVCLWGRRSLPLAFFPAVRTCGICDMSDVGFGWRTGRGGEWWGSWHLLVSSEGEGQFVGTAGTAILDGHSTLVPLLCS